ncbi:MAG: hypothetical protein RR537_01310 [Longicatena sp.]
MQTDNCENEVENLEKEAKFTIISLDEDENDKNEKKILDDAKYEITKLYEEFRQWLKDNIDSDETSERIDRLKQETQNLLAKTKTNLKAFNERESTIAHKEKVVDASSKLVDKVNDGVQEVLSNEYVGKAIESVSDTFVSVKNDERVKDSVKKLKKGTLKIAESAFNSLKKALDTDDQDDAQKG